jgi:diguanylate cyclase (GGDEF)-like protein
MFVVPVASTGESAPQQTTLMNPRLRIGMLACVAGILAFVVLLLAFPGGDRAIKVFDDIAGTAVTAVVGLWCLEAVVRRRKLDGGRSASQDWIPISLGLVAVLYSIGHGIRTYCDIALHDRSAMPPWVNAGYLLLYPVLLLALLKLPTIKATSWKSNVVMDSLMTMTALVTFSWYYVLGPAILTHNIVLSDKFTGTSYPFADLILTFCLIIFTLYSREMGLNNSVKIACLGLIATFVADAGEGYMVAQSGLRLHTITDIGWPLGYGLIAFAGLVARREIARRLPREEPEPKAEVYPTAAALIAAGKQSPWAPLLPYSFVPPLIALVGYVSTHNENRTLSAGVYIGSCMVLFLVLMRQVFVIIENNKLTDNLRHAYEELQTVHKDLETQSKSLAVANERLEGLAATDGMTGLANHRKFQERIREEWSKVGETGQACALLLMDVDHFKQYNDTFGHPAGDGVLKSVAKCATDAVRPTDLVARYGGEEFAVILPATEARFAVMVAERIRKRICGHEFENREITVSIGLSTITNCNITVEQWISSADSALYDAKHGGRNRVATHGAADVSQDPRL